MKKLSVLLVLAGIAGGIVIGKTITSELVNELNPFKDAVYDCRYQYDLPNGIPQERWFDRTESELLILKSGSGIHGLLIQDIKKYDDDYHIMASFVYGQTIIKCEKR